MTSFHRILAIAALAAVVTAPAAAQTRNPAVTVYDQPQQQDFFFQMQRQGMTDRR
ncbi:MAG: hypothetical protein ACFE0R_07615 [Salinarimonas sp.]